MLFLDKMVYTHLNYNFTKFQCQVFYLRTIYIMVDEYN